MIYHRRPSWHIPEALATDESTFFNRRQLLATMGLGGAASALIAQRAHAATKPGDEYLPTPERNDVYKAGDEREITDEEIASTYNNFYEFGSHKQISKKAQKLDTDNWMVKIDGEVEKDIEIEAADLTAKMPVEERVTRFRCVEAWSMVVPWICYPLAELVKFAKPTNDAKYVRFETFLDPKIARGQKQSWYPWPYVEGMTIKEAMNPVALMVVGVYGKVLPKQYGAPMRLHIPWKYGFKSSKSITRISFTKERPVSFWQEVSKDEYGFWANVNPEVRHPRWSQAEERVLGTTERIPTQKFNGYGEEVAGLYSDTLAKKEGVWLWR